MIEIESEKLKYNMSVLQSWCMLSQRAGLSYCWLDLHKVKNYKYKYKYK